MNSYYKRYIAIAVPYTLALFFCWNYIPIPFDIPVVLGLVVILPMIMRRFLVKHNGMNIGTWTCLGCGHHTKKSPCPRCQSTQFKIV